MAKFKAVTQVFLVIFADAAKLGRQMEQLWT